MFDFNGCNNLRHNRLHRLAGGGYDRILFCLRGNLMVPTHAETLKASTTDSKSYCNYSGQHDVRIHDFTCDAIVASLRAELIDEPT